MGDKTTLLIVASLCCLFVTLALLYNFYQLQVVDRSLDVCYKNEITDAVNQPRCLENLGEKYLTYCWITNYAVAFVALEAFHKGFKAIFRLPQRWTFRDERVLSRFTYHQIIIVGITFLGTAKLKAVAWMASVYPSRHTVIDFSFRYLASHAFLIFALIFGFLGGISVAIGDISIIRAFLRLRNIER